MKKVFVIGCGRWGTFIAWYLDKIGHDVKLYGRSSSENMKELMATRKNKYMAIPESLTLTTNLSEVTDADYIIISVGSQALASVIKDLDELGVKNKTVVLCMKGIEIDTGRRLSQIASGGLDVSNEVAVWLGSGHVQEFYRGVPNCMVIDSTNETVKDEIIKAFSSDLIRFYYGTDLIGNEIFAAAKNVVGIAAGLLEGLDLASL
ncbi:MAG: NAD(P)-binding domain-containing protein, partial [Lachnospiraceae bacterium]|nr:NAD(P)-binding domain-containing protein [Lachnospiraceae bacterium]